jgi:hypothetical protein
MMIGNALPLLISEIFLELNSHNGIITGMKPNIEDTAVESGLLMKKSY